MTTSAQMFPKRGEVYDVFLDPVVGSEIGKRRPAVVVSNDVNNRYARTVTVIPITGGTPRREYPFEVRLPGGAAGLTRDSRAKCDQIRTVDKGRMTLRRGALPTDYQVLLDKAIKVHLGLM